MSRSAGMGEDRSGRKTANGKTLPTNDLYLYMATWVKKSSLLYVHQILFASGKA